MLMPTTIHFCIFGILLGFAQAKGRKNGTDGAHIDSLKGRFQSHRGLNDGVQFNVYTNVVVKVPSNSGVVEGEKLTVHCQVVGPEAEANALQQISNKTELGKSELIRIPSKSHKVHCTEDAMRVEIALPAGKANDTNIYLEGLKGYPDERCKPKVNETWAEFKLSLEDFYDCGITRMVNKLTGKKVYYHKIIIEEQDGKEIVSVKCITTGPIYNVLNRTHAVSKRDVLPAGFQEAEDLDITMSYTKNAPEPIIDVGVRQGGQRVTGELNVSPGTPLTMEIFLDETSSPVYGLGVTYMEVTDTKNQEETIIFNGCSIDPYLFENFNTVDGDFLSAKFRAFKFPESTYVQFRATVNVCLDKCQGTPCSNGQIGYGRRRREIRQNGDPNKVYEFSLATFIKVDDIEGIKKGEILELEEKLRQLQLVNQKLARNSRGSASENDRTMPARDSATVVEEETLLKIAAASSSKGLLVCSPIALSLVTAIKLIL